MAYIKVDHKKLDDAATAVETYVSQHKSGMKRIDQQIVGMNSAWQGKDYDQLKAQWQEMNESGSTSKKMLYALEDYADFLRYSAKKYKDAQSNAVNRANKLPRY